MRISTRSQTAPFIAMDVLAEAQAIEAAGARVIHMEVGEPAYGAPRAAREALAAAMGRGETLWATLAGWGWASCARPLPHSTGAAIASTSIRRGWW